MTRVSVLLLVLYFAMDSLAISPHRLLVISAPSQNDISYQRQAAELVTAWSGLVERDFMVRTKFQAGAFSIVLIGKDGEEKLRRESPLTTSELFSLVDAMPMRRAEMGRKP